jgi:hypothetical protein
MIGIVSKIVIPRKETSYERKAHQNTCRKGLLGLEQERLSINRAGKHYLVSYTTHKGKNSQDYCNMQQEKTPRT